MAGAATDDRADALEVRLEPPRPHVVRVAVDSAYARGLAANVTSFGHDGLPRARAD
jgi:hypothetical protein